MFESYKKLIFTGINYFQTSVDAPDFAADPLSKEDLQDTRFDELYDKYDNDGRISSKELKKLKRSFGSDRDKLEKGTIKAIDGVLSSIDQGFESLNNKIQEVKDIHFTSDMNEREITISKVRPDRSGTYTIYINTPKGDGWNDSFGKMKLRNVDLETRNIEDIATALQKRYDQEPKIVRKAGKSSPEDKSRLDKVVDTAGEITQDTTNNLKRRAGMKTKLDEAGQGIQKRLDNMSFDTGLPEELGLNDVTLQLHENKNGTYTIKLDTPYGDGYDDLYGMMREKNIDPKDLEDDGLDRVVANLQKKYAGNKKIQAFAKKIEAKQKNGEQISKNTRLGTIEEGAGDVVEYTQDKMKKWLQGKTDLTEQFDEITKVKTDDGYHESEFRVLQDNEGNYFLKLDTPRGITQGDGLLDRTLSLGQDAPTNELLKEKAESMEKKYLSDYDKVFINGKKTARAVRAKF